jgi:tripartite-type tricarboxylate transporter receptor subunit TctC
MFSSLTSVIPHLRSSKLKAFATTGARRSTTFPDVPTVAESGFPGYEATSWYGILAPAKTAKPIITLLHKESVKALALPDTKERLNNLNVEIIGSSPEAFGAFIRTEIQVWGKVIKASGMKPD